ncbi:translesion error-prone DNA polymerase V autoproteolytic subunit [Halopseudomonas sp. SMJS2]|uniref:LexA family protein n=1 Tax=Halopseudomonas sp. SMJS2 TaxID=3041098 RepID=UPI002452CDC1|nr:translesion error-prone DNA polymerase V autoproteolytic subunit [Halopseudomonas sp. SMJS2]WGK60486.1 translesion error-prone DNA polymerase V autoproteolytic subunit [Halopseudomonas sp. SMJS2]
MSSNAVIIGPLTSSTIELPFYSSRVPAGFPSPALDHMDQPLSLDELMDVDAPHTYLVLASGDSMIGVGIFDEDVMVVNRKLDAVSGHIVIAWLNGDVCVKRLKKRGDQFVLESENPKYMPRYIMEGDEFEVWGVVTGSLRRFLHG